MCEITDTHTTWITNKRIKEANAKKKIQKTHTPAKSLFYFVCLFVLINYLNLALDWDDICVISISFFCVLWSFGPVDERHRFFLVKKRKMCVVHTQTDTTWGTSSSLCGPSSFIDPAFQHIIARWLDNHLPHTQNEQNDETPSIPFFRRVYAHTEVPPFCYVFTVQK